MTADLDLEEQRMLAAARSELSPDALTTARVRAAAELALLVPPIGASLPGEAGPLHVLWHAPGLVTRVVAAVLLGSSAGLVGYALGARPAPTHDASEPRATTPLVIAAPVPLAAPATVPAPEPEPAPDVLAAPEPEPAPVPDAANPHPARSRAPATPSRPSSPAAALQLELSTVKRVESELRVGNPSRALELLRELDQAVPGGQLREERRAADAIARCALGLGDARALAEAFSSQFPGSVYEARVRQRCDEAAR